MILTTHGGTWPSPSRCTGRKHSGFSESKPFTWLARRSQQGGSPLLPKGLDQEDRPRRGRCLAHQEGRPPHGAGGPSLSRRKPHETRGASTRVGGPSPPSPGRLPHGTTETPSRDGGPSLPHLGAAGSYRAGVELGCGFSANKPL